MFRIELLRAQKKIAAENFFSGKSARPVDFIYAENSIDTIIFGETPGALSINIIYQLRFSLEGSLNADWNILILNAKYYFRSRVRATPNLAQFCLI